MIDLLGRVEDMRIGLGLSQRAVANALSITQPHYSKVVGGLATLTTEMEAAMTDWLDGAGAAPSPSDPRATKVRMLVRSIELQVRQLNSLLAGNGVAGGRRSPRRARGNAAPE